MLPVDPLVEVYARLEAGLRGLDWYLFGARAAIVYGSSRATIDIDITVDDAGLPLNALVERLSRQDFSPRIDDWADLAQKARVLLLHDRVTGTEIDLVLAGPGLEQEFVRRARRHAIGPVSIPVISPEDLVASKLLAGRAQDIQDVADILRRTVDFDADRCRDVLGRIERALDRADLLRDFDILLSRAQSHR